MSPGRLRFRIATEDNAVVVAHSEGDLWCVSGRIPFDDDDSAIVIQARNADEAGAVFKEQLLEAHDSNEADLETDTEPAVYINAVFRFACRDQVGRDG